MPVATVRDIRIAYETLGNPGHRPLLLIAGLVTQLVGWPDRFCEMLVEAGHFVIRFDNRDVGLSTRMETLGVPDLPRLAGGPAGGRRVRAPYSISDMAADAAGLLDVLGLDEAWVCGFSMGGMIAQVMALEHPKRVAGLISLASTTGEADLPGATAEAGRAMMSGPPARRSAYIDYMETIGRVFAGGSARYDADLQRDLAARAFDRAFYLMGFSRQMAAILKAPGRRKALGAVRAPSLVIHGDCDPVMPPAHGLDTARALSDCPMAEIRGLGHGLAFPSLWPEITAAVSRFTARNSP